MRAHSATFSTTLRRDPIHRRLPSPIAPPERLAGSPASTRKRGITSKGRSFCSDPAVDEDLAFRFGQDQGVSDGVFCACIVASRRGRSRGVAPVAELARIASLTHGNTIALGHMLAAQFALMLGGPMRGDGEIPWSLLELLARTTSPSSAPSECSSMGGRGRERLARGWTARAGASTACARMTS